jgi:carbamoyl-phosphate synthase large subunit
MFQDSKVFVSGGAGVIGTALVERLLSQGARVFVADLKPRPSDWPASVRYRQGDLNTITLQELAGFAPDFVFHLAATFERSVETPEFWDENDRHNVRLSHHLMGLVKQLPSVRKVIFASSYLIYNQDLYTFDAPAETPVSLKEEDPIYPRNLCGAAKLLHEIELQFLSHFSASRFKTVSARIYRVYGKNSRDVISRWIQALLRGETLQVYRKEGMFDYVYAEDVAEGLLRLGASDAEGIVNLATGRARRVSEVLDILRQHFPEMKTVDMPSDIRYEASQADVSRLQSTVGWKPDRQLEDVIPLLIEHYRKATEAAPEPDKLEQQRAVLVSSVSRKVPLVQMVREAIHKLGASWEVVGGDLNPNCIGSHFVDRFWHMPPIRELRVDQLIEFCHEQGVRYIVPTRDGELPYFAAHRDALKQAGISVMISEPDVVDRCLDKLRFYRETAQWGFPAIPTSDRLQAIAGDRIVVKERFGAGSRGNGINLSRAQAEAHAETLQEPIFQPYIEGYEVSADCYVDRDRQCKGVVLRTRDETAYGESQVTTTFRNESLERMIGDLAVKLGIYGHAVFQFFVDRSGKCHIIECNPRLGGASRLSLAYGLDSLYWFLLESQGESLRDYPFVRSGKDKRLIRYAEDRIE